jgi:hypothetical protein
VSRRARIARAYFRTMGRLCVTSSPQRYAELDALANRLAEKLAGYDQLTLFGGAR